MGLGSRFHLLLRDDKFSSGYSLSGFFRSEVWCATCGFRS